MIVVARNEEQWVDNLSATDFHMGAGELARLNTVSVPALGCHRPRPPDRRSRAPRALPVKVVARAGKGAG